MQILSDKRAIYLPPQMKWKNIAGEVLCSSFLTTDFEDFTGSDFQDLGWE